MLEFKDIFPFGVWQSTDADRRWKLDCNENGVQWTELKSGQSLVRQVSLVKTGPTWRIDRPNDTQVLSFLGARPAVVQAILARNPAPSFMEIVVGAADVQVFWNGLFWTVDRNGNLATMEQPGSNPARRKQFQTTRSGDDRTYYEVGEGQLTFDAEGVEAHAAYHSRWLHHPSNESGVTVGRGFDMKERSSNDVSQALVSAGLERTVADLFAAGAGKSGQEARDFVSANRTRLGNISPGQQKRLFDTVYREKKQYAAGVYGRLSQSNPQATRFDALDSSLREVYVDIIYQGYPASVRGIVQPLVERNDARGLGTAIDTNWANDERWQRRRRRLPPAPPLPQV